MIGEIKITEFPMIYARSVSLYTKGGAQFQNTENVSGFLQLSCNQDKENLAVLRRKEIY